MHEGDPPMKTIRLTLSSKNYSSWSLRAGLMAAFSGLPFDEVIVPPGDVGARKELLLLSPSILVPRLQVDELVVWDTLAIGETLHELAPKAGLLPSARAERAHCRAICGEMHSGFASLRAALPMNLRGDYPGFKVWTRAQDDLERIFEIWREALARSGGPFLFGARPGMADAMYAPVVTRIKTYHVPVDAQCQVFMEAILALPALQAWTAAAREEPDDIEELDMEF